MQFSGLQARVLEIKQAYNLLNKKNNQKMRSANEYVQGFMGDVGMLAKLVMAKTGYRNIADVDVKLEAELLDCLWSIIVIADEFSIDLEGVCDRELTKLKTRVLEVEGVYQDSV